MRKANRNYTGLNQTMSNYTLVDARLDSRVTHLSAADNLIVAAIEDGIPVANVPKRLRRYRPLRDRLSIKAQ